MRVLDVELPRAYRRSQNGPRPVIGVDTESMTNGYAFLVADSRGRYAWIRSFDDVVSFFNQEDYAYCILVAFNLNFDASVLLKWLGEDLCTQLVNDNRVSLGSCMIEYIPSKYLQFRFGNRFVRIFDVAQYFQGSLDWNAKQYLHMAKGQLSSKTFTEADYARSDVLAYCIKDAFLAQGLGEYVVTAFDKLGVNVQGLASPANILESYVLDQLGIRNNVNCVPREVLEFAVEAFDGAWFENFKAGYFPKTYRYDMVSAYPSVVRDLVDLSLGHWVHSKVSPADALYGHAYAKLTVPMAHISPIVFRNALGDGLQPHGTWCRHISKCKIDWLRVHGGRVDIIDAWWFVPAAVVYKFRGVVDKFFEVKANAASDSMEKWSAKIALAGMYGKFLQHKRGIAGRLYNPVYADEITSRVRLEVADAALQKPEAIIAVMSDCVSSVASLRLPLGDKIGEWSPRKTGESLWIGPAQYEAEGRDDRLRRIPWKRLLRDSPDNVDYDVVRNGPLTLLQGVRQNNFEAVGVFADLSVTFNVRKLNWRRFWPVRPDCGRDLLTNQYDSRQLSVGSRLKKEDMVLWEL